MTNTQLYLSIGIPLIWNTLIFVYLLSRVEKLDERIHSLEDSVNTRINLLIEKIHEVELKLK